jgi:hypothetical protein
MVIAALAWNIKSWFAMMMHRRQDRRDYRRMEFRRFLTSIILIPAMVVRRARGITVRLVGYTPNLDRLFSAWHTTEPASANHNASQPRPDTASPGAEASRPAEAHEPRPS